MNKAQIPFHYRYSFTGKGPLISVVPFYSTPISLSLPEAHKHTHSHTRAQTHTSNMFVASTQRLFYNILTDSSRELTEVVNNTAKI